MEPRQSRDSIVLDVKKIIADWRAIGSTEHLQADADIAKYLTTLYFSVKSKTREETDARCTTCNRPLTFLCTACHLPAQNPSPQLAPPVQAPQPSVQHSPATSDSEYLQQTAPCHSSRESPPQVSYHLQQRKPSVKINNHHQDQDQDSYVLLCKKESTEEETSSATEVTFDESQTSKTRIQTRKAEKLNRNVASVSRTKKQLGEKADASSKKLRYNTRSRKKCPDSVKEGFSFCGEKDLVLGATVDKTQTPLAEDLYMYLFSSKREEITDEQQALNTEECSRSKIVSGKYIGALTKPKNGQLQVCSSFECAHCQETFNRKRDFNKHISTHFHGKPYICIICGEGFKSRLHLRRHKHERHSKLNKPLEFSCELCQDVFKSAARFLLHKKLHEEDKLFTCKRYGFKAASKEALVKHRQSHRNWVQCEYCGITQRKDNMSRHILVHRGEKPYQCSQCDSAFRILCDLKRHVKGRHSEVKPFGCEICGKTFLCSGNLKHHLFVHKGEKPYKCSLCPSSFSRRDYLAKHTRTHTGEKPYKCSDCGEYFAYNKALNFHREKCHGTGENQDYANLTERHIEESGLATQVQAARV